MPAYVGEKEGLKCQPVSKRGSMFGGERGVKMPACEGDRG